MKQSQEWTVGTRRVYAVRVIAEAIRGDVALCVAEDLQHHINISQEMTDKECEDFCEASKDPRKMWKMGNAVKLRLHQQYEEASR